MLSSDVINMLTSDLAKMFTSDLANMFTSLSANIFTSDLANMFTSELEKCKKMIWLTSSLVKLAGYMLALYQEYDTWSLWCCINQI